MRIFVGQGNFTDDTDESYNELSGTWEKVPDSGRGVERCGLPQYDGDRHRTVRPEDQGLFDICGFRRSGHEASVFEVVQFRSGESLVHRIDQRIARDEDHQGRGTEIEGFVADVLPDPYRAVFRHTETIMPRSISISFRASSTVSGLIVACASGRTEAMVLASG